MKKTQLVKYYLAASVALATILVYLPALRNEFITWDDMVYIFENSHIRSVDMSFFKWAFLSFYVSNWHPLTWISHALDFAVWGLNPLGHHLCNNVLHTINAFLVVFLIMRLLETAKERATQAGLSEFLTERTILITAGVTGLLFGLHPLHVESVAWVSERKDLLCALFFLLSIIQYTNFVRSESSETARRYSLTFFSNKYYLLTLGFFILALLSKPMALTLPVLLLILDWYPFNRIPSLRAFRSVLAEKLPFIALSLASSIITVFAQYEGMMLITAAPLSTRLLVAAQSLILYLWKMIWPLNLVPLYLYPKEVSFLYFKYLSAIALVIGITIACIIVAKKQRVWLTAWGYYIVTLMPVIGIVQVGYQSMADRYTYLPSLGPFVVMGLGAAWIFKKSPYTGKKSSMTVQLLGAIMAIFIFAALAFLTVKQIGIWKNSFVFWDYVLEKEPIKSPIPYFNLGMAYEKKGLLDEAMEQYQIALRVDPYCVIAHNKIGEVYERKGLLDQAIEQYQVAVRLDAHNVEAHNNLGVIYEKKGLLDQAMDQYRIAVSTDPDFAPARNNLGEVYERKGLLDQAIEQYEVAVGLAPGSALAHNNLGVAYIKKGLLEQAIEQYQSAVRLGPDFAPAHNNLGEAYQAKGLLDKAIEQYMVVLRLSPDYYIAHNDLGAAYLKKGMKDQAIEQFKIAVKLNPESPKAHNNLGIAYDRFGLADQAIEQFQRAVRLDPSNPTLRKNLTDAYEKKRLSR